MNEQLDNESLLLLYAAGELSAQERATVDQRLASEPALREALRELSDTQAWAMSQLDRADEVSPLTDTVAAAVVRRSTRALRQARVEQLARRPATQPLRRTLPFGWRSYTGAAIAAGLFVALLVWWGSQDDSRKGVLVSSDVEWPIDTPLLDDDLAMTEVPSDADDEKLAMTYGSALTMGPAELEPGLLPSSEQELRELSGLGRGNILFMGMQ